MDLTSDDYQELGSFDALREKYGAVPVTDILLHEVAIDDLVKCWKLISFRASSPHVGALTVIDKGDFPLQE